MSVSLNGTNGLTFADSTTQNTGGYTGFRNRIINGDMRIWQRGTSTTTQSAYLSDRWFAQYAGSSFTYSQSTDTPSSAFQFSASVVGSTGGIALFQRAESFNCRDLAGQSVTVSFWAKQPAGSGAGSLGVQLWYPSAQDNWTSATAFSSQTVTGTSSWAQYSVTFSSVPAGVANGLQVQFFTANAGAGSVLITGIQLEKGFVATPFENRPYGTELSLCQRYYEFIPGPIANTYTNFLGIYTRGTSIYYQVSKRTTPTISFIGTSEYITNSNGGINFTPSAEFITDKTFSPRGGNYPFGTFTLCDAGTGAGIQISAEL